MTSFDAIGRAERTMTLPTYPWRFAHLAALWAFGVSQPVFSMLQANPEFLVINGATRTEAMAFAVVVTLLPPLVAVACEVALGFLSKGASAVAHILFVWAFGFTALVQLLSLLDPASRWSIALPGVAAYLGAMAYARWRPLRSFLSVSLALPVVGLVAFLVSAPLAVADAEGARVAVRGDTPVVLIVFDEFPLSSIMRADGSIDDVRYPGFGRLAREATWYSRATTVHEYTTYAIPSIVTGRLPTEGLPTLADFPDNLFTLLGESYAFRVDEPVTRLCPVTYCREHRSGTPLVSRVRDLVVDVGVNYLHGSLPREFHGDIAPLREGWGALIENMARGTFDFTQSIRRSNPARTLYFLHLHQPHSPWMLLPSGRRYGHPYFVSGLTDDWTPSKFERWRDGEPLLVAQALQRHLLEVVHVDAVFQRILERLETEGLYDRALIVVTADHGINFRAGGWKRHLTRANAADIAGVPLFVKYPGQKHGREDRRDADVTDVLPTVADVLGAETPWAPDGRSLRSRPVPREVRLGAGTTAITASHDQIAAGVLRTARRNASLFGKGEDSFFRFGPRQDLLGRDVASIRRVTAPAASVSLSGADELGSVHKASGYVPVHVVGRVIWDDLRSRERLAIAVNGRIASVTTPFRSNGRMYFSSLVDEAHLRDGPNRVEVFAVRGDSATAVLVALGDVGQSRSDPQVARARLTTAIPSSR